MGRRESSDHVKRLEVFHLRLLDDQNRARVDAGIDPIKIRIRRCLSCSGLFESTEKRLCGCQGHLPEVDHVIVHFATR